ncbi:hypothetical protein D3C72_2116080 [compost metagenome]
MIAGRRNQQVIAGGKLVHSNRAATASGIPQHCDDVAAGIEWIAADGVLPDQARRKMNVDMGAG